MDCDGRPLESSCLKGLAISSESVRSLFCYGPLPPSSGAPSSGIRSVSLSKLRASAFGFLEDMSLSLFGV